MVFDDRFSMSLNRKRADMTSTKVTCKCGKSLNIEDACARVTVATGETEYTCNRCSDWYHNFGDDKIGSCVVCGRNISKETAHHHEGIDDEWGYFSCPMN